MPVRIDIELVDTHRGSKCIYRVPDNVKGVVILRVIDEPVRARTVTVSFGGKANIEFTKGIQHQTTYIYKEDLTQQVMIVPLNAYQDTRGVLDVGSYLFPFSFRTQDEDGRKLYSSINDSIFGNIKYQISAVLSGNKASDNITKERKIILQNLPDILALPQYDQEGKRGETEKSLGCFIQSGNITLEADIPKGAYTPGESIEVTIVASNYSRKLITPKVKLLEQTRCMGHGAQSAAKRKVFTVPVKDKVLPMTGQWMKSIHVLIPHNIHPGSILDMTYMEVTYEILVCLSIPWATDLNLRFPIVIGK